MQHPLIGRMFNSPNCRTESPVLKPMDISGFCIPKNETTLSEHKTVYMLDDKEVLWKVNLHFSLI